MSPNITLPWHIGLLLEQTRRKGGRAMRGKYQIWLTLGVSCLFVILPYVGWGADISIGNNVSTTGNWTVNGTISATSFSGDGSGLTNVGGNSKQPFQATIQCTPTGSYWYSCDSYTAPKDARLVISQVGISFVPNDSSNQVASLSIQTMASGASAEHGIEPPAAITFRDTFQVQRGSRLTKIYADAGSTLNFTVLMNKSSTLMNEQRVYITLSGEQVIN
jgi:hypothetical protein